jgi:hypothetical protein
MQIPEFLPCPRALALLAFLPVLAACGGGGSDPVLAPAASAPAVTAVAGWIAPATLRQFDLSAWKLNLPVDAGGASTGAAQTLSPEQLVAGYASAWFHADAQGRIVFTAPANGAVTTPGVGSDHTRSELREFHRGPGADANGYWTGAGTLAATCSVQAVASAARTVIIGQLRSEAHDLALLVLRPATGEVAIDVYARPASDSPHAASTLLAGATLGQPLQYTLSLAGGTLTASVNGASRAMVLDPAWGSVPLAFKLGAYHTAPSSGNAPDDATVVACSAFALTH